MRGTRDRGGLYALLTANAISVSGNTMTLLAVPLFVLATTGSASRTGITGFFEGLAFAASAGIGGLAVDRLGKRRASVLSDLVSAVAVAGIPVLNMTVGLRFWQLLALVTVAGLARAPGETARDVMVPDLVRRAESSLERVTSAYDGVSRGARMVGAPVAGVLVATYGGAGVLLIDAATFLISAMLIGVGVPKTPPVRIAGDRRFARDLREGLGYLRRDRLILAVVTMVLLTNMFDAASGAVLTPVWATRVYGSAIGLGAVAGVFGFGALAGTVAFGAFGPRLPRRLAFTVAFLLAGAPRFAALALTSRLAVVLAVMVVAGFAAGAINPIIGAVLYERVPDQLQSRVFGVVTAGTYSAIPLGALLAGYLVSSVGLFISLVAVGGCYLLVTLSPVVFPSWQQMDARRGMAGSGVTASAAAP